MAASLAGTFGELESLPSLMSGWKGTAVLAGDLLQDKGDRHLLLSTGVSPAGAGFFSPWVLQGLLREGHFSIVKDSVDEWLG